VKREVTIWGIGRKFTVLSVLYLILALVAHYIWYPLFVIQVVPYAVLVVIGLILMAIGIPIWVAASKAVDGAFEEGVLATQGVYALCRHPIYGNAIFFTIPGILLFFRSWLLLTVPVAMYVIFKLLIGEEEEYLRQEFGPAYPEYEKQVNAVFPKLWKLRRGFWYPVATGQVAENVYAVRVGDVNMFIYTDGDQAIAVDAAYSGDALREELQRLPINPQSVTHLFLTHGDVDHTGGLDLFPNAQVYLSRDEEQMVNGTIPRLFWLYHSPRIERAYTLLAGGDVITVGTIKVRAIATPGHTPGSLSYLVNDTVLFTGDTLTLQNGLVHTFYRLLDMDVATQRESIKKLARLRDVTLLCTAHTGCTTDWDGAMRHWREKVGTHPIPARMSGG
jgi:hydroxyacylglutathione hydrolase